jgi:3-deoxy-7-phosphoheptulonate synthase
VVTEIVDIADIDALVKHVDCLQVGARNMQNFELLKAVGQTKKPVLLKRGMSARIEELLLAAEYVVAEGNDQVILCERGIRTFDTYTRNTLDLNAVPYLKQKTHLPVVVDPSHGTGVRELVIPMAKAAAACGADGLIVEVHHDPSAAKSDGQQSLYPEQLRRLMREVEAIVLAVGRTMS